MTNAADLLPAERLRAWAFDPAAGDELVYAGPERPAASISAAVRQLAAEGAVTPHCRRVGGRTEYLLRRARRRASLPPPVPGRLDRGGRLLDDASAERLAVLTLLRKAARAGRPCPCNRALALAAGLKDADRARYRLRQLREAGLIEVETTAAEPRRVVTIVATGRRTGVAHG